MALPKKTMNDTSLEHWNEWFTVCAAQWCSDETKNAFSTFAHKRYKKSLTSLVFDFGEIKDLLEEKNRLDGVQVCWLDFETSHWYKIKPSTKNRNSPPSILDSPPEAKTYKKYWQERSAKYSPDQALVELEKRASLEIRGICRNLKKFHHPDGHFETQSMNQPLGDDDSTEKGDFIENIKALSPEDYSTANDVAAKIEKTLTDTQRHIWLAALNYIEKNDPLLLAAVNLKKSSVSEQWIRTQARIKNLIWDQCGDNELLPIISIKLRELLGKWAESNDTPYLR